METLTKKVLSLLNKAKRELTVLKFDELNVMQETDRMYAGFYTDAEKAFRDVYLNRYLEVLEWLGKKKPDEDELDELLEMWLAGFLKKPNETTHYAYESEIVRKRDRAKEAIIAVPTKLQKNMELEKAGRFVIQQNAWYCDFASQEAELQAMKDADVKKVIRIEQDDDRTCETCRKLHGKVYEIDKVPPLEHLRCRRSFRPYET